MISLTRDCCRTLRAMHFWGCAYITDAVAHVIGNLLPGLQELTFAECQEITDRGVKSVAKCSQLRELSLDHNGSITDAGELCGVKTGRVDARGSPLSPAASYGTDPTQVGVQYLNGLAALESLQLEDRGITDLAVAPIIRGTSRLRLVILTGSGVADETCDAISRYRRGANQSGQRRRRGCDVDISLMNRDDAAAKTWIVREHGAAGTARSSKTSGYSIART